MVCWSKGINHFFLYYRSFNDYFQKFLPMFSKGGGGGGGIHSELTPVALAC